MDNISTTNEVLPKFATIVRAVEPETGVLKTWSGPTVEAATWEAAEDYCREYMPYCRISGVLGRRSAVVMDMEPEAIEPALG